MSMTKNNNPAFDRLMEEARERDDNTYLDYLEAQYLSMTRPHRERFLVDDEQPEQVTPAQAIKTK